MTRVPLDEGRFVRMVNVARVCPAGIVTEVGTVATFVLLLLSRTTAPPAGAGAFSDTVPVLLLPPTTVLGLSVRDSSVGGFTVSVA